MNKIGDILKAERIQQGKGLKDIERETKIRAKYLLAIEKGEFNILPGGTYAKAFIKSYCQALNIDSDLLLEAYKEISDQKKVEQDVPVIEKSFFKPRYKRQSIFSSSAKGSVLKLALALILVVILYFKIVRPLLVARTDNGPDSATASQANIKKGDKLILKIEEPGSWIKLTADGKVIYQKIAKPKTDLTFTGTLFKLVGGNAGSVKVSYKGAPFEVLGAKNDVVRKSFGEDN